MRYAAFFYEQTIAVVLEDRTSRLMHNCTLLEVIPAHEQTAALQRLGEVMALEPLALQQMLLLQAHCYSPEERDAIPKRRTVKKAKELDFQTLWAHFSSLFAGILPGTQWCGMGDQAKRYHRLGAHQEVDACCRDHDHCPLKVKTDRDRYGVTNPGVSTVSHCMCDKIFLHCLEKAAAYDDTAKVVGHFFFNVFAPKCVTLASEVEAPAFLQTPRVAVSAAGDYRPRLQCERRHQDGSCRSWADNPKALPLQLALVQPNLNFTLS